MTYIPFPDHLAHEGHELDVRRKAAMTHKGMAHFAGTGPAGKHCRECVFWQKTGRWFGSGPAPARCGKFQQLTRRPGPSVPHNAHACRHFELTDRAQPLLKPAMSVFDK